MKVYPVRSSVFASTFKNSFKGGKTDSSSAPNRVILQELEEISNKNKPLLLNPYSLGLSHEELLRRTGKDELYTYKMLPVDSDEFNSLDDGDKNALVHLLKAGQIIDEIELQIDDSNNIPFRDYLDSEIQRGNEDAKMTKRLFDAQKGIFAIDNEAKNISLANRITKKQGIGVYPHDLSQEEFHSILIKMLNEGKTDEVARILNQRSFVERKGDELAGIDYVDKFKEDFSKAADEIEKAAETSTNKEFNEFLRLQAKALRTADPMLDAYADSKWAELQDTPLEFTVTREGYEDSMTPSVYENDKLKELLDKNGIEAFSKDSLGVRVGIINKESTDKIIKVKEYLPYVASRMPRADEYQQDISKDKEVKQAMVDADIINLYGELGACRAGVTAAENLPNSDKLALRVLNGGKRNVYHRQIMNSNGIDSKEYLNALFDPSLHKYYSKDAGPLFVVGHENGHSLGPKKPTGLGKYTSIIEENKADLVSPLMADVLSEKGLYTDKEKKEIVFKFIQRNILKAKPEMSQAHRVRSLMQMNYLIEDGAVQISDEGIISADLDKAYESSQKMLNEVIDIQLANDSNKALDFINKYYYWSDDMEKVAQNYRRISKSLNAEIDARLADKLLYE